MPFQEGEDERDAKRQRLLVGATPASARQAGKPAKQAKKKNRLGQRARRRASAGTGLELKAQAKLLPGGSGLRRPSGRPRQSSGGGGSAARSDRTVLAPRTESALPAAARRAPAAGRSAASKRVRVLSANLCADGCDFVVHAYGLCESDACGLARRVCTCPFCKTGRQTLGNMLTGRVLSSRVGLQGSVAAPRQAGVAPQQTSLAPHKSRPVPVSTCQGSLVTVLTPPPGLGLSVLWTQNFSLSIATCSARLLTVVCICNWQGLQ